jgi:hypothetical protein
MEQHEMENTVVVDKLETLELKLKGISSALQLIAEANNIEGSDYSLLNVDALQFIGEAIEDVSNKYVRESIERLLKD